MFYLLDHRYFGELKALLFVLQYQTLFISIHLMHLSGGHLLEVDTAVEDPNLLLPYVIWCLHAPQVFSYSHFRLSELIFKNVIITYILLIFLFILRGWQTYWLLIHYGSSTPPWRCKVLPDRIAENLPFVRNLRENTKVW